jgi:FKBP-type peptidyl-prolyl cis-trans isomerase SlyD
MKPGDFVEVDYIGKIKGTGEIFDLTKEDIAKKEDVYNPKTSYKPVVLIVGADFIIKGLDEALRGMKIGEKKNVDIPPSKAFGERKDELIKTIPSSKFKEQNLDPFPGGVVNIGNMRGRIMSVDGGRVRVDFNHPLAGKTLEYEIEIKSTVKEKPAKVKAVVKYFTGIEEVDVVCKSAEAEINIKKDVDVARPVKKMVSDAVIKWCGVDKVKFVEVFEKSRPEAESSEKKAKVTAAEK